MFSIAAVGRDRRSRSSSSPKLARARPRPPPSATTRGPGSCSSSSARCRAPRSGSASEVTGPLRVVKDAAEIDALRAAARAVDGDRAARCAPRPFAGRTEADVHRELVRAHARRRPPARQLRHRRRRDRTRPARTTRPATAGDRARRRRAVRLRRHAWARLLLRHHPAVRRGRAVRRGARRLRRARRGAGGRRCARRRVGTPCEDVDAAARRVITDGRLRRPFIHRTGHGIGVEAHEDPYIVAGNATPLAPGHAFSVEPGIYLPGRFGLRLEDIVVATADGPERLNQAAARPRRRRAEPRPCELDVGDGPARSGRRAGCSSCWVTTRRREVGLGYGWLLRVVVPRDGGRRAAVVAGRRRGGTGAAVRNVGAAADGARGRGRAAPVVDRAAAGGRARPARARRAERAAAGRGDDRARRPRRRPSPAR